MIDTRGGAERWWPQLSIEGKHSLLRELEGALDERVRDEIAEITGGEAPERLSASDVRYIETQIEAVD
jgi:hypothetical protein